MMLHRIERGTSIAGLRVREPIVNPTIVVEQVDDDGLAVSQGLYRIEWDGTLTLVIEWPVA